MSNPFIRKLEGFAPLSADHRREINALTKRVVRFGIREDIVHEGEVSQSVNVVMSGWACRYKVLPDGRRQIIALFLPGDMCDPYVFLLGAMDHGIGTLGPCDVAKVPAQGIHALSANNPPLLEALWWQTLVAFEAQREWTISIGRRTALERIAHLFCEVLARLAAVGLSNGSSCEWPLRQSDLADATGLSTVHVNRILQELRTLGFIDLHGQRLTVHNHDGLAKLAMFDPAYLHRRTSGGITHTAP